MIKAHQLYPMQLNWQIAKVQRFWITTMSTTVLLVTSTWLETLEMYGVNK